MAQTTRPLDETAPELLRKLVDSLPQGFETTFIDPSQIQDLESVDLSNRSSSHDLSKIAQDYSVGSGSFTISERDVIEEQALHGLHGYVTPEVTFQLPGLALALENDHLLNFVSEYKQDDDTPTATVRSPDRADTNDLVFSFATPQVYNQIAFGNQTDANAVRNFRQPGISTNDDVQLVGDNGVNETANTDGNNLSLDDDEWLFYTGDFIDLEAAGILPKLHYQDLEGESDFGHTHVFFSERVSGVHISTGRGSIVRGSTVDLDAPDAYFDGDAEMVPVAYVVQPGDKHPAVQ